MSNSRLQLAFLVVALGSTTLVYGQTPKAQTTAPDNTKTNKTAAATPTADSQKQNQSDVEIIRQIRQLLTKDKTLSTYAKNVKIVSQKGDVTLSGPVHSEDEKKSVEAKATQIAGQGHVKSQLLIDAKPPAKKSS